MRNTITDLVAATLAADSLTMARFGTSEGQGLVQTPESSMRAMTDDAKHDINHLSWSHSAAQALKQVGSHGAPHIVLIRRRRGAKPVVNTVRSAGEINRVSTRTKRDTELVPSY